MAAVQFNCPHCQGMYQVDSSLAGMQVSCPHCQQVATLPASLESSGSPPGPASSLPPPGAQPGSSGGDLKQFQCPQCQGPFRVSAAMAGMQVSCPHCRNVVTVPPSSGDPAPAAPQPPQEPAAPRAESSSSSSNPAAGDVSHPNALYPPGFGPPQPSQASGKSDAKDTAGSSASPSPSSDLYPPGFRPTSSEKGSSAGERPQPTPPQHTQPQPAPRPQPAPAGNVEDLLPPGASGPPATKGEATPNSEQASSGTESWPGPSASATSAPSPSTTSNIDEMLPPGASALPDASSSAPQQGPTAPQTGPTAPQPVEPSAAQAGQDAVVIPTEDGSYVAVRDKGVKTVKFGGEEVEVRRLTPEEKKRRRLIMNLIMAALGILFLTFVTVVLVILT